MSEGAGRVDGFDSIERAIADIAAGRPVVVVVDDADRENEGDLVFAGEKASAASLAFMVRHTSGFICASLEEADADRLELPPMHRDEDRRGMAYAVTVDARDGISTGVSAADRAHTVRLLADPGTRARDMTRPGHVVPMRARTGGVLRRPGHSEAAVDLVRLAGLRPVGALCALVNDDGTMMRLPDLAAFAGRHGLALITIADLVARRRHAEQRVTRAAEARIPTGYGEFRAVGYRSGDDDAQHVAFVCGDIGDGEDVLVRLHSECLTGDAFGSLRCDCGSQLRAALRRVAERGRGVVLYVRSHEGRGIGLLHKLAAYQRQDLGRDTVEANVELGLPVAGRDYGTGAQILRDLGVRTLRLLTNNAVKCAGLERYGLVVVGRERLSVRPRRRARGGPLHESPSLSGPVR